MASTMRWAGRASANGSGDGVPSRTAARNGVAGLKIGPPRNVTTSVVGHVG